MFIAKYFYIEIIFMDLFCLILNQISVVCENKQKNSLK